MGWTGWFWEEYGNGVELGRSGRQTVIILDWVVLGGIRYVDWSGWFWQKHGGQVLEGERSRGSVSELPERHAAKMRRQRSKLVPITTTDPESKESNYQQNISYHMRQSRW